MNILQNLCRSVFEQHGCMQTIPVFGNNDFSISWVFKKFKRQSYRLHQLSTSIQSMLGDIRAYLEQVSTQILSSGRESIKLSFSHFSTKRNENKKIIHHFSMCNFLQIRPEIHPFQNKNMQFIPISLWLWITIKLSKWLLQVWHFYNYAHNL